MSAPARLMPTRLSSAHALQVQPAVRRRGMDHGVLTAHLVGGERQSAGGAHRPDDVQVGQCRLDHDDVGSFGHVQLHFPKRLPPVRRVHLVLSPVPELRRALGRVAEGPVEGAGVLGRVAHDRDMLLPRGVQGGSDGPHHAVDHPRRRDHVGAGGGVHHRGTAEQVEGLVVQQIPLREIGSVALLPGEVHGSAVTVIGVLAEAHVRHHHEIGQLLLQGPDGGGNRPVRVEIAAAATVLELRDAEEDDRRHAQFGGRCAPPRPRCRETTGTGRASRRWAS